ncbi:MAG TPA: hypothetical protein VM103_02085 [Candidatus Paceibacterota bacterium]|nr:hypothetical protein [Candidatus Paceibacterota bacterium]
MTAIAYMMLSVLAAVLCIFTAYAAGHKGAGERRKNFVYRTSLTEVQLFGTALFSMIAALICAGIAGHYLVSAFMR